MDFAALQHSVFLQALGSAILNSLWQCFILWFVYETISLSYKSAPARFKNNLGTLLLFCSFTWFLATFFSKVFNLKNATSIAAMPGTFATEAQPGVDAVSGFSTFLSYASASLPYLSVAYIFLLFLLMSRLAAAYRYVYFISNKRLVNPTGELQVFASKVAREIGITKKISIWISHHIDVPATIGFFKPIILIPLASINNLSCHQLEAVILHELAHIKRNDYITNLIISVIETILFFNPFIVLLSNIIKRERENCCDDFVLQYRYDPHSYASALLRLEQSRISNLKLAISAVSGKKQLLSRIKRITNGQVTSRQFNYGQRMTALLLITAFICSVAWLSPGGKKSIQRIALAKSSESVTVSTTKSADKVVPPGEINEISKAAKQLENLPALILKHISPKIEHVIIPEANSDNSTEGNSADENANEGIDNLDFLKAENNSQYPEAVNIKQPAFYLDENGFKLPPSLNIKNFPFQNMNVNIDLSKIDVETMNKNLKEAYKQINHLDWNKVQEEIRKSFSKMKIKPGGFLKTQQDAFSGETAKVLSRINMIRDEQQYNWEAHREEMREKILLRDSFNMINQEATTWNDHNIKVQHAFKKVQQQDEKNAGDNYYFNYTHNTDVADKDDDEAVQAKASCDQLNGAPPISPKKTVTVSIKRISNHTGVLNEKKPVQFSFYKDDDEKTNQNDVFTVEIKN